MQALGIWIVVEPVDKLRSNRIILARQQDGELEPVFEAVVHSVGVNIQSADKKLVAEGLAPVDFKELAPGARVLCRQIGARRIPGMGLVALEYGQVVSILDPTDDERREKIKAEEAGPVPFTPGRPKLVSVGAADVNDDDVPMGPRLIV